MRYLFRILLPHLIRNPVWFLDSLPRFSLLRASLERLFTPLCFTAYRWNPNQSFSKLSDFSHLYIYRCSIFWKDTFFLQKCLFPFAKISPRIFHDDKPEDIRKWVFSKQDPKAGPFYILCWVTVDIRTQGEKIRPRWSASWSPRLGGPFICRPRRCSPHQEKMEQGTKKNQGIKAPGPDDMKEGEKSDGPKKNCAAEKNNQCVAAPNTHIVFSRWKPFHPFISPYC